MSSKTTIAIAIQTMCGQIINNTNSMQTIANDVDSNGIIVDFVDSLSYINNIGKLIDAARKSGFVDVVTNDSKVMVNAIMKYSTGISSSTTKMVMGSVNVTNFFTIINPVSTGASYNTDYTVSDSDIIYPDPYDTSEYLIKLSNLVQGFSTLSTNLNMFVGSSATMTTTTVLQTQQADAVTNDIVVNGGIINELQIITSNLTLSNTSGNSGNNSYAIGVDTGSGAVTITLPNDAAKTNGRSYKIFDAGGNASTNNITISGNGLLIGGSSSITISTNYESTLLIYSSVKNKWFSI